VSIKQVIDSGQDETVFKLICDELKLIDDLFVHHSEIQAGGEYATLNDGQTVECEVGQGQKGPCANKVGAI
jgi:hypothetical protein